MCSIAVAAATPTIASATSSTGGVAATAPATTPPAAPAKPKLLLAPITAKAQNLAYHGPVYVKTVTGSIVPYTPLASAGQVNTTGGASIGQTNTTGGASIGPLKNEGKPELLVPGNRARYVNGLAAAPMAAPRRSSR